MPRLLAIGLLLALVLPGGEAAAASPGEYGATVDHFLRWVDYLAVTGIGWGAGVTGWVATGHQAARFLFARAPSSWTLWRRKVLTSPWPLLKYVFGGVLLLVLGVVGGRELLGLWSAPFQTGVWIGGATGVFWSVRSLASSTNQVDVLLANRRHVDERRVRFSWRDDSE